MTIDYEAAWRELRAWVESERSDWDGKGRSKDAKVVSAAMTAAYGSVVRAMDAITEGKDA
jgi:hypothetical protein